MRFCEKCRASFQSRATCPRDNLRTRADIADPMLSAVIGDRYRILDRIAAGGMGQVYRASHVRIASLYAVKVLYGDLAFDPDMRARFQREAEATSLLSHRHIVRVFDFGETAEGLLYLTMEYVDGAPLSSLLAREGRLGEARAVMFARQIARGLAHAHERGIVHRDLKTDNVLVVMEDEDEEIAKILDFGLAQIRTETRLTQAGQVFGTPQYMAPEQFFRADVDLRADLYSLGIMLVELLTGTLPYDASTVGELARLHMQSPPPSVRASAPQLSPALDAIVARLLAKSPDERFPSARSLLDALRPLATPRAVLTLGAAPALAAVTPAPVIAAAASAPGAPLAPLASLAPAASAAPAAIPVTSPSPAGPFSPTTVPVAPPSLGGSPAPLPAPPPPPGAAAASPAVSVAPPPAAATPARPVVEAVPLAVRGPIEIAILRGAPAYNSGDHAGCAAIYAQCATALMERELAAGPVAARARLRCAFARAQRSPTPAAAAWELRYALNDLHDATRAPRPPETSAGWIGVEIALAEVIGAPQYASGKVDLIGDYYLSLVEELAATLRARDASSASADYLERVARAAASRGGGQRALAFLHESLSAISRGHDTMLSGSSLGGAASSSPGADAGPSSFESCPSLPAVADRIVQALGIGVPAYNAGDPATCARVYRQAAAQILAELGTAPACASVAQRLRAAATEAASRDADGAAWAMRRAFDEILAVAARRQAR